MTNFILTGKWNGAAISGAFRNWTRTIELTPEFGRVPYQEYREGNIDLGRPDPMPRYFTFIVESALDITGLTEELIQGESREEVNLLNAVFRITDNEIPFTLEHRTSGGAATSRYINCRSRGGIAYYISPDGVEPVGSIMGCLSGKIRYEVMGVALWPFFRPTSLSTAKQVSGSTVVMNSGENPCGMRATVDSKTGTPITLTLTNNTNGDVATIVRAGGLAVDDYYDFMHTAYDDISYTSGLAIGPTSRFRLAPGSNDITIAVDTGTIALDLEWRENYDSW